MSEKSSAPPPSTSKCLPWYVIHTFDWELTTYLTLCELFQHLLLLPFRTVHLCCRLSDKKLVIIKQIPVEQMTKEERQAALNEVKVLSMLHHLNIIEYYENFLEDKALMIVMEYAQGSKLNLNRNCERKMQQKLQQRYFFFLTKYHLVNKTVSFSLSFNNNKKFFLEPS